MTDLEHWLAVGDLDELVREVDRRCEARDWEGVETVRRRSRAAIERGHQLWPAASYAEYRLALEAPPGLAASVIHEMAGWMAPGPLTEVVAQNHTFAELADGLDPGPTRVTVAAERVVRGEVPTELACGALAGGIPARLARWEPAYALASYDREGARFDPPPVAPPRETLRVGAGAADVHDDAADGARCLVDALRHWTVQSEGTVRATGVEGTHIDALGALGLTEVRWRRATLGEVGALLAWGAADGGVHGRRRGASVGRFELWWTLAVLAGVDDDWPCDPGPPAGELRYGLWLPTEPVTGWSCRITVEDPIDGLAWALDASDADGLSRPAGGTRRAPKARAGDTPAD